MLDFYCVGPVKAAANLNNRSNFSSQIPRRIRANPGGGPATRNLRLHDPSPLFVLFCAQTFPTGSLPETPLCPAGGGGCLTSSPLYREPEPGQVFYYQLIFDTKKKTGFSWSLKSTFYATL